MSKKKTFGLLLFLFPFLLGTACDSTIPTPANEGYDQIRENTAAMNDSLTIKIGDREFTAALLSNPTATAFKALLPLTINMTELNGNEKYFRLSKNLPTNESNPGRIKEGDLMLYGSNTLVLFYEGFPTSYSYTRLGRITDTSGLGEALGGESVQITIRVK